MLTRFERQAAIQKEKQLALAEHIRQEEARDLTFKPQGQSAKSKRLMEGYGDVLEMRAREEERALRLRQLVDRAGPRAVRITAARTSRAVRKTRTACRKHRSPAARRRPRSARVNLAFGVPVAVGRTRGALPRPQRKAAPPRPA